MVTKISPKDLVESGSLKYKKVKGFDNYFITDCGRIYNKKFKEIVLDYSNEYKRVNLYKNGKVKRHFVHVLVANHFCRRPKNSKHLNLVVNHKDHNKHNCHKSNLEYTTQSDNIKKYHQHKRLKDKQCQH